MDKISEKKKRWVVFLSSPVRFTDRLDDFLRILEDCTPRVEYRRRCTAYLEFGPSYCREPHPLERIRHLRRELGRLGIPICCGVGSNKLLARSAARLSGEGEALWILPQGEKEFLDGLAVDLWPEVGPADIARMKDLGLRRLGDLGRIESAWVKTIWGKRGLIWREQSRGYDPRPVVRRLPRSHGASLLPQPRLFPPQSHGDKLQVLREVGRYLRGIYGRAAARLGAE